MSRLGINTGSNPNDGQGDTLRTAMGKINSNFTEIYNVIGDGNTLTSYASTAGISTLARNLTGSPKITVGGILNTGITTTEHIQVRNITSTGVVTATQFVGDGSQLSNVSATWNGVDVLDENVRKGVAKELNFGDGLYCSAPDGIGRVTIAVTTSIVSGGGTGGTPLEIRNQDSILGTFSKLNFGSNLLAYVDVSAGVVTVTTSSGLNLSGVVTATSFVGNGSGLTNLPVPSIVSYSSISGYSTSSGIATNATSASYASIAGYSTSAGIATNATNATNASYAVIAGYSTSSGIATNATTASYATIAGYSTSAGISTTSQGLTGTPNISVNILSAGSAVVGSAVTINNGGVRSAGVVTASSFVRSGGTSAQFLKADGSVDSNTYLTSYTEVDTLNSVTGRGNTTANGISVGILTATSLVRSGGTSSQFLKADGSVDSSTYATQSYVGLATAGLLSNTGSASSLTGLTGAAANTYGNATSVAQLVVDANGRITSISNVLISGGGGGGTNIIVRDDASVVGAAGTIDFGVGLTVTPLSVGIVTVNATYVPVAGYSTSSGIATNATTASYATIAGYSTSAGVSTTSGYSTIAGYSTSSGVSTSATTASYATIAGYSTSSGIATNATTASYATIAGYSTSSGVSTTEIGRAHV